VSVANVNIPDVARALVRRDEQTLRVVDLLSGDDVGEEVKLGGKVRQVWTAPYIRRVVVLDDSDTLTQVDLTDGKRVAQVKSDQPIQRLVPGGNCFVTVGPAGARAWVAEYAAFRAVDVDGGASVAVGTASSSPPAFWLAAGKTVTVCALDTGKPVGEALRFDEDVSRVLPTELGPLVVAGNEVSVPLPGPKGVVRHSFKREAAVTHCWALGVGRSLSRVVTVAGSELRVWSCNSRAEAGKPVQLDGAVIAGEVGEYSGYVVTASKLYTWSNSRPDSTAPRETAFPSPVRQVVPLRGGKGGSAGYATLDEKGTVRLVDPAAKEPGPPLDEAGGETFMAVLPALDRLLTCDRGGRARLWDPLQGKPAGEPFDAGGELQSADVTGGKQFLITRTRAGRVRPFRLEGEKLTPLPTAPEGVVEVTASGTLTEQRVLDRAGKVLRLWNPATGKPLPDVAEHADNVLFASVSESGDRMTTMTENRTLRFWSLATGRPLGGPLDQDEAVKKGDYLTGQSSISLQLTFRGKEVMVWDVVHQKPLRPPVVLPDVVTDAFFINQNRFVTLSGKKAQVWDAVQGKEASPAFSLEDEDARLAAVVDNVLFVAGEKEIRGWNLFNQQPVNVPRLDAPGVALRYSNGRLLALTRQSARTFNLAGQLQQEIAFPSPLKGWSINSQTGALQVVGEDDRPRWVNWTGTFTPGQPFPKPSLTEVTLGYHVAAAGLSPDGKYAFTQGTDGTAQVWDVEAGKALEAVLRHEGDLSVTRFTPDGRHVVTRGRKELCLWETATGARRCRVELTDPSDPWWVSQDRGGFSSDGQRYHCRDGSAVRSLDLATGETRVVGPPDRVPHGKIDFGEPTDYALFQVRPSKQDPGTEALVWDLGNDRQVGLPLALPEGAEVVLGPAGRYVLVKATVVLKKGQGQQKDVTVTEYRVWDARSGQPTPLLLKDSKTEATSAEGQPVSLDPVFTPDGRCLVTVNQEKAQPAVVLLRDARTGDAVTPPVRPGHGVASCRVSGDGRWLLLVGDGRATAYDLSAEGPAAGLIEQAEVRAGKAFDKFDTLVTLRGPDRERVLKRLNAESPDGGNGFYARRRLVYQAELARAEGRQDGDAAAFYLERLLALPGDDHAALLERRGRAYTLPSVRRWDLAVRDGERLVELAPESQPAWTLLGDWRADNGDWAEARDAYRKAKSLKGAGAWSWGCLALTSLMAGDEEGYHAACEEMLDRFEGANDAGTQQLLLWVCVIAPDAVRRPERLVALAEKLRAGKLPAVQTATLHGGALLRAGRPDECVRVLTQLERDLGPNQAAGGQILNLFLGLAHARQGDKAAEAYLKRVEQGANYYGPGLPFWSAAELEITRRQVAAARAEAQGPEGGKP
jgi:WD40 repeat protein